MRKQNWPKRDPIKNYFPLPNEIYALGLSSTAIAVYGYLLHREDRKTYQCLASYRMIGETIGKCTNTVRKYVMELEERGLIRTERTTITTQDGRRQNGCLLYTILPIQEAINHSYERQMVKLEEVTERQQVAKELRKQGRVRPCEPLCEALPGAAGTDTAQGCEGGFGPVSEEPMRTKVEAG